jgi:SAM-dependent methyltransferase
MANAGRNAREAWRHFLFTVTGGRSTRWSKKWRNKAHLQEADVADRFAKIYASNYWSRGREGVPGSGDGSTLDATAPLRERLPGLVREHRVRSFLDVGCGDFTWMRTVDLGCPYVGADIVPAVIATNQQSFGDSTHRFEVRNAISDELPEGEAVLCRDMLFHLSLADGLSALRNILSKDRRLLIFTTDGVTDVNGDIITGDYRARNLRRAPFNFPEPIEVIDDSIVEPERSIGVWRAEDVRRALGLSG